MTRRLIHILIQKNYGFAYDITVLIEIISRLQRKDVRHHDYEHESRIEEEKRDSTQYLMDSTAESLRPLTIHRNQSVQSHPLVLSKSSSARDHPIRIERHQSDQQHIRHQKRRVQQTSRPSQTPNTRTPQNPMNPYKANKVPLNPLLDSRSTSDSVNQTNSRRSRSNNQSELKPFASHMTLSEVQSLRLFDAVDHRDSVGKFCTATIVEVDPSRDGMVKVHYDGYPDHHDIWCNVKQELFRFAKYRSISRRFQAQTDLYTDPRVLHRDRLSVGDIVDINPMHTEYGGNLHRGIINQFDRKSDQIQVAFKPNMTSTDYVLYWSHIDNNDELRVCAPECTKPRVAPISIERVPSRHYSLPQLPEEPDVDDRVGDKRGGDGSGGRSGTSQPSLGLKVPQNKRKRLRKYKSPKAAAFSGWNTKRVIEWINGIGDGKFKGDLYGHFKGQIEVIGLKGYELITLNETALKFAGLLNGEDRKIILHHVLDLVNSDEIGDGDGREIKTSHGTEEKAEETDGSPNITGYDIDPILNTEGTRSFGIKGRSEEEVLSLSVGY